MPRRDDRPPDIELGASVKAKRLRFRRVPETETRKVGDWESTSERTNLPDEVEPDATYRDVEVVWHSEARMRAEAPNDPL